MLIKVSGGRSFKQAPNNLSDYDRTYNNAIDLVTQAVGWANKVSTRKVAALVLKPTKYRLFIEGLKLLMKKGGGKFDETTELTFEGYKILQGSRGQIDSLKIEYVENTLNHKVVKPTN
jgi:hypothetical protein